MRFKPSHTLCTLALLTCLFPFFWKSQGFSDVSAKKPATGSTQTEPQKAPKPELLTQTLPQGTVYIYRIPAGSGFTVRPLVTEELAGVNNPVWQAKKPVFIINGGYFDPKNMKSASFVTTLGKLTADPRDNERLTENSTLTPYLPLILNRTEFRVYTCNAASDSSASPSAEAIFTPPFHNFNPSTTAKPLRRYDITPHDTPIPTGCKLNHALGAGPAILPTVTSQEEGFTDRNADGKLTRDPIGVNARNARSAVGLTEAGDVLLMMGAQDPKRVKGSGFSLSDMAKLLKEHGAVKAMGLDGGSSSAFQMTDKTVYGKFNADGTPIKRPIKSILAVIRE